MKYGIAKRKAQEFANERKNPVYIARAVKNKHFVILFDKSEVTPNHRIWETVNPDPYDINVVIYGKSVIGKSKAIERRM